MKRGFLAAAGMVVASVVTGCATPTWVATAEQIRRTDEGGMILLGPGMAPQAAARDALATIEAHCGGEYEVIETAKMDLSRAESLPPVTTYYVGTGSSGPVLTVPVYGTSVVYLCRRPENTDLNRAVAAFASQDFLGKICSSDRDCGFYTCTRGTQPSPTMICTAADGSIQIAREGEPCDSKPCMAPLRCLERDSASRCVNP